MIIRYSYSNKDVVNGSRANGTCATLGIIRGRYPERSDGWGRAERGGSVALLHDDSQMYEKRTIITCTKSG